MGKSTLFNRLLREKRALVHSLPGMTRDWVSSLCTIDGKKFILTDTGGYLDYDNDPLSYKIKQKAWEALLEADLLLFVMDGKRELTPAEEEFYFSLKKLNKVVVAVINKIESDWEEGKKGDLYNRLRDDNIISISAEHKRNIDLLTSLILESIPFFLEQGEETRSLRISIIGRINVGKSSIVNRLCGKDKLIVSELPGTTRDCTDTLILREGKTYTLVDTAGIRKLSRTRDKREKASIVKAKKDISNSDVICLVMDAKEFPTRQDTAIAHIAKDSGKPLMIALNKWDLINKNSLTTEDFKEKLFSKLDFVSYAPLLFLSAISGQRVYKILECADFIYANACKRVPTSQLNNFLSWIMKNHPPFSKKKQKIKIKYITQSRISPPTFLLFTHSKTALAPSYKKFLSRLLCEKFELWGSPVRIFMRKN